MKLMVRNSDNRILNAGEPPWSNEASLAGTYTIIDIGDTPVPINVTSYFYSNGTFTYDSSDDVTYNSALSQVKSVAQSAVGVQLQNLTATQVRALMAILLMKAGGVKLSDLTVKPLNEWVT